MSFETDIQQVIDAFDDPSIPVAMYGFHVVHCVVRKNIRDIVEFRDRVVALIRPRVTWRRRHSFGTRMERLAVIFFHCDRELKMRGIPTVYETVERVRAATIIQRCWMRAKMRRDAIRVLRPAIIHWAFRPGGPLMRRVARSFDHNQKNTGVVSSTANDALILGV